MGIDVIKSVLASAHSWAQTQPVAIPPQNLNQVSTPAANPRTCPPNGSRSNFAGTTAIRDPRAWQCMQQRIRGRTSNGSKSPTRQAVA